MTDNEIIKALECHSDRSLDTCTICPLLNVDGCAYMLTEKALELINCQKAEIERLLQKLQQPQTEVIKDFEKLMIDKSKNGVVDVTDIVDYAVEMVGGKS